MKEETESKTDPVDVLFTENEEYYLEEEFINSLLLQPLVKISVAKSKKRLLSPQVAAEEEVPPEIKIAVSCICVEQLNFICTTLESVSENLKCTICLQSSAVDTCTHLVVGVDRNMLCARTPRYINALLKRKSIVSFMWYTEIFDTSMSLRKSADTDTEHTHVVQHIDDITTKYIVHGDRITGKSDAPMIAHREAEVNPFFKEVNISDPGHILTEKEVEIIKAHGGLLNSRKTKRRTIVIRKRKDLYEIIAKGTQSVLYLNLNSTYPKPTN